MILRKILALRPKSVGSPLYHHLIVRQGGFGPTRRDFRRKQKSERDMNATWSLKLMRHAPYGCRYLALSVLVI